MGRGRRTGAVHDALLVALVALLGFVVVLAVIPTPEDEESGAPSVPPSTAVVERTCRSSRSALVRSADAGRLDDVRAELERGTAAQTADEHGFQPLYCAVAAGHHDVAMALLNAGARPDDPSTANDGTTNHALNVAVTTNRADLAALLLERAANPNVLTEEHTALNNAIEQGLPDMAALL